MLAVSLQAAAIVTLLLVAWLGARVEPSRGRWLWLLPSALLTASLLACGSSYHLQKWLGGLLMPLSLAWHGWLACCGWQLRRRPGAIAALSLAVLLLTWLATNRWVGSAMVTWLERDYRAQPTLAEPLDAALLLGGATSTRPSGEVQLSFAGDRVATAARLHERGKAQRIVCSGNTLYGADSATQTMDLLAELGVERGALVPMRGAVNTSEEIAAFSALAKREGWQRLGLISSAMHLRRATRLAARADLEVVPIAAEVHGREAELLIEHMLPRGDGAMLVHRAAWELLGAAVGR